MLGRVFETQSKAGMRRGWRHAVGIDGQEQSLNSRRHEWGRSVPPSRPSAGSHVNVNSPTILDADPTSTGRHRLIVGSTVRGDVCSTAGQVLRGDGATNGSVVRGASEATHHPQWVASQGPHCLEDGEQLRVGAVECPTVTASKLGPGEVCAQVTHDGPPTGVAR